MAEEKNRPPLKRFEALLDLIPPTSTHIVDVGYDHGILIKKLVRQRPHVRVFGVEKQADAARRFWASFSTPFCTDRIQLRCGDGLEPVQHEALDTAVFAGLNEAKIAAIVNRSPLVLAKLKRLVFAPQDFRANLRHMLFDWGWRICDERIAFERQRFYTVTAAERGRPLAVDRITGHFGSALFQRRDPLLYPFLLDLRQKLAGNIANPHHQPPALRSLCLHIDAAIEIAASLVTQSGPAGAIEQKPTV